MYEFLTLFPGGPPPSNERQGSAIDNRREPKPRGCWQAAGACSLMVLFALHFATFGLTSAEFFLQSRFFQPPEALTP